jgi:tetratricopeptide (TPR) repeat protein
VTDISFRKIPGLNQQTYQRLKLSLSLHLRRQIFVAVCDDLPLRDRMARQLVAELTDANVQSSLPEVTRDEKRYPRLVSLELNLNDPNPIGQIAQWVMQYPPPRVGNRRAVLPMFQFTGIEQLTRQPAAIQRLFFAHLQNLERNLSALESGVLFWMPRPWFNALAQSAPDFWLCRTGTFEFISEPTPLPPLANDLPVPQAPAAQTVTPAPPASPAPSAPPSPPTPSPSPPASSPSPVTPAAEGVSTEASHNPEDLWTILTRDLADLDSGNGEATQDEISGDENRAIAPEGKPTATIVLPRQAIPPKPPTSPPPLFVPPPLQQKADALSSEPVTPTPAREQFLTDESTSQQAVTKKQVATEAQVDTGQSLTGQFHMGPPATSQPAIEQEELPSLESPIPQNGQAQPGACLPVSEVPSESASGGTALDDPDLDLPPSPTDSLALPATSATTGAFLGEELTSDVARADSLPLLRQIEVLHQRQAPPEELADAYRALGNFYRDRIEQGDASPQALQVAVHAYEQVLVWLHETSPVWTDVLNDLGNLYWMQSRYTSAMETATDHLHQAIQAYQLALSKVHPQNRDHAFPMLHNNLGSAYADLARYQNPVENLQRAVQSYQQTLRYRTADNEPLRYASTQNNLGTAYWSLAQYQQPEVYLKQAIAAYSEALKHYTPEVDALSYAMIQNNLGTAYWNLSRHERPMDWLRLAVVAYQTALRYRTLEAAPAAFAATQNNLGTAYWHLATQLKDDDELRVTYLHQATAAYEATLAAAEALKHQPQSPPLHFDLLATHNNLGLAHYQLATDIHANLSPPEQSAHLELALHHHLHALEGWQERSELRQTAFSCLLQTIRALYNHCGLDGQNVALSKLPGHLLPEVLAQL